MLKIQLFENDKWIEISNYVIKWSALKTDIDYIDIVKDYLPLIEKDKIERTSIVISGQCPIYLFENIKYKISDDNNTFYYNGFLHDIHVNYEDFTYTAYLDLSIKVLKLINERYNTCTR